MKQAITFFNDAFAYATLIKQWQKFTENKTCHTTMVFRLITRVINLEKDS